MAKNPIVPTVAGVGYRGIGKFSQTNYPLARAKWGDMLHRVYNPTRHGWENYGGRGVQVDACWHNFQNFAEWIVGQRNYGKSGYELDKDILMPERKLYSVDTCCLVPREINTAVMHSGLNNGLPLGVSRTYNHNKPFRARMHKEGVIVNIGVY
ncbi:MAG: hypothetical protein ACXW1D_00865 [Halobacteriota archaeon]